MYTLFYEHLSDKFAISYTQLFLDKEPSSNNTVDRFYHKATVIKLNYNVERHQFFLAGQNWKPITPNICHDSK